MMRSWSWLPLLVSVALPGAGCKPAPLVEGRDQGNGDLSPSALDLAPAGDLAGHCTNGRRDGGESDVDCGGPCPKCAEGRGCGWAEDCKLGACIEGRCARNRVALRGTFPAAQNSVHSVGIAEVTSDGLRDVLFGGGRLMIGVLARIKGGTFRALGPFDIATHWVAGSTEFCIGDVSGDGRPDVVAGGGIDPYVVVAENDGAGRFVARTRYRVTANDMPGLVRSLACGDFDGDGDVDVVVSGLEEGMTLLRNRGKGTLAEEILDPNAGSAELGPAADMDGDGITDLAVQNTILTRRLSAESSCARTTYSRVVVGDFNGDGRLDIGGATEICLGDGRGGLQPVRPVLGLRGGPMNFGHAWAGDVNGDGRTDLVVSSGLENVGLRILNIAPGRADGNLVFTSSVRTELEISAGAAGRLLSETRDDVVVGLSDGVGTFAELQILTFN